MTATVTDLGITTAPTRVEVVRERPVCSPADGGAWQIARVEAHETVSTCVPAMALAATGAAAVGQAGKWLTGAYNSAVVGAQLCPKGGKTKRCAKKRRDRVQKCTEERDEGYDECAAKADRGYNRCCDWAPCSWFCKAWVWVSNIVCVAWTWVSNIVCVAWAWITNVVCVAWEWIKVAACVVAAIAVGIVKAIVGIILLIGGLVIGAVGKVIGLLCLGLGAGTRDQVSESLKVVAVHMALLRTGKVLLMGYDEGVYPVDADHPADFTAVADSDRGLCAVWDPATGKARYTTDLRRNLFCAHHSFLPDGRLLVAGGQFPLPGLPKSLIPFRLLAPGADADLHVFDPVSETWRRLPDMQKGRWYPTCVTLPDGRVFITSGTNGYATSAGLGRGIQNTWEYADGTGPVGGKQDTGFFWFHLYPFQHVLTDGHVFTHADRATRLFDPANRTWSRVAPKTGPELRAGPHRVAVFAHRAGPRHECLAAPATDAPGRPLGVPDGSSDDPRRRWGRGRARAEHHQRATRPAREHARHADCRDHRPRRYDTGVARDETDGQRSRDAGQCAAAGRHGARRRRRSLRQVGRPARALRERRDGRQAGQGRAGTGARAELFDPGTETWRTLCRKPSDGSTTPTAMLLPDGRVLVAGHDGALNMEPFDRSRYELELFSPPYLFAADGSPAARPVLAGVPESIAYGQRLEITASAHIRSAALIRPSALTHQINPEQRYVGLGIEDQHAGGALVLPLRRERRSTRLVSLFVVADSGTPSIGSWVQVGIG